MSLCIGQPVDGPQNGPVPGPWDIPATFREVFKNETQNIEVPHTAYVKVGALIDKSEINKYTVCTYL